MPDLPKYIGIEGSHVDFVDTESFALGGWSQLVAGDNHDAASKQLNDTFAVTNSSWNDDGGEYPHMSELYVRVRDVRPLLEYARKLVEQITGPADAGLIDPAELQRALAYLEDIK